MARALLFVALFLILSTAHAQVAPVGDYALTVPANDAADRFDFEVTNTVGGLWRNAGCIEVDLAGQGAGRVVDLQTSCELTNVGFLRENAFRACILNSMALVMPGDRCSVSFKVESAKSEDGLACLRATSVRDDNLADNVAVDCIDVVSPVTTESHLEAEPSERPECARGRNGRCELPYAPR